jgi:hypothetical protein
LFDEAKRFNLSLNIAENVCWYCVQRAGLYAGWELVFRLPITAAD